MIKLGKYRHFKGNEYEVIANARHSEDLSEMVVYRRVHGDEIWVRPAYMWDEEVSVDGKIVKRFEYISE